MNQLALHIITFKSNTFKQKREPQKCVVGFPFSIQFLFCCLACFLSLSICILARHKLQEAINSENCFTTPCILWHTTTTRNETGQHDLSGVVLNTARPRNIGLEECVSQRYMVFNWIQKHLRYTDFGQKVFMPKKYYLCPWL